IRGEYSEGMLCSAKELGLGTDHAGILEIHGDFTPGESFVKAMGLDDVTLEVEITSNRGDLLGHVGIARELAAEGRGTVVLPEIPGAPPLDLEYVQDAREARVGDVGIRIEAPELCSRYLGAVIRGVEVGPSPAWLQERLRGAGARPINNVVDATNYVLLESGQPLHAFDLALLGDASIVVRRAGADEKTFTTLDGEDRTLTPDMLLICDARRPVAVAGVMGGQESEVTPDTVDVLLECALFDPKSIRATRRALVLSTDASYRFERGVDPEGLRPALERAVALILATAGGSVDGPVLDVCPRGFQAAEVPLRVSRIEHVLGVAIPADTVRGYLEPLGLPVVRQDGDTLHVKVPGFRSYDITREIDLIEEVARSHGYDVFPQDLGAFRPSTVPDHPMFRLEDELRDLLVGRGFFETQTPAFVPAGQGDVRVSNPLNAKEPFMRSTLLPSLLRRVEYNFARGARDVRLFEMGTSFRAAAKGEPPVEENHLAVVVTGRREPPHWSVEEAPVGIWDLKALAQEVADRAHRARLQVEPRAQGVPPALDPSASFAIVDARGRSLGGAGRIRADAVDAPVWADDVWGIEVTLPAEVPPAPVPLFHPLPAHPGAERDLALLVPESVPAARVLEVIGTHGGELLEGVSVFDHYRGEGVAAGVRSLAFNLRFRAPDRTLKDKEVDRAVQSIVGRLEEELGVHVRG
ncbi:MAG TPA: phenylalanine--tRNA ligase subunit beta, partial [Longimicrobiales bacterium]|nr:phenylalanine--tRNA ligase subunit beta [Longimicrobiales bacterium]